MLKRLAIITVCAALTTSIAVAQQAVTAESVTGTVLVNHGNGFVRVANNTPLLPGDRLVAKRHGQTDIVYPGGCVVHVRPGTTVTVSDLSPCSAVTPVVAGPGVLGAGTLGVALAAGGIATGIILATNGNRGPGAFNTPNNINRRRPISP